MKLRDMAKKVVKSLGMEKTAQKMEVNERLRKSQEQLARAISSHSTFRSKASIWDDLYNGTKAVSPVTGPTYMSNRFGADVQAKPQDARQVVNIIFQLVESQIDKYIPRPLVEAREEEDHDFKREMVEGMLTYLSEGPALRRLNTENERICKKNGFSVIKVVYNPDKKAHNWRGEISIVNPHPINIIPQPGVHRVQDMDYIFHIENRTIDYICRVYGEEFREQLVDASAEFTDFERLGNMEGLEQNSDMRSLVEKWFKDKDGDIGVQTWCDDIEIRYIEKFFYRRDENGEIVTQEEIETEEGTITVDVFVPKKLPFVIQYNVPKEKSFYGKSDPEVIFDQQEGIKKMLSIEEEKQTKGTTKIIVRAGTGLKDKINNAVTQVLETDDPQSDVKVIDMKTHDGTLVERYTMYVQAAKDALGVTEASQGRAEVSNLSGKAIELLAVNSSKRMDSKKEEKDLAFIELYQLLFDFLVAFYDEPRPFRIDGPENKPIFGYFERSKLLKKDIAGTYYWPEFDINITADMGLPKTREFVLTTATEALQYGAITPTGYWTILQSINFPNADKMLEMAQQMEGAAPGQELEMVLGTLSQMSPETREMLLSKPIEEQIALIQQVIGGVPNEGGEM